RRVGGGAVAAKIVEVGAPIGGEGNGGVMYPALHCGRDAPVAAALVLELHAGTGRRVSEVVAGAPRYAIVKAKLERGTRNTEPGLAVLRSGIAQPFSGSERRYAGRPAARVAGPLAPRAAVEHRAHHPAHRRGADGR